MLCERLGWELDYVESLDIEKKDRILNVLDGADKGRAWVQKRASSSGSGRARR